METSRSTSRFIVIAFLVGLLAFGSGAGAAYATASSQLRTWHNNNFFCYKHQARSQNTSVPFKAAVGQNYARLSPLTLCGNDPENRYIGAAAYLKKTNGAACATASPSYLYGSSITRNAYYNSTSCGTGVQLQGTTTSYGYNIANSGYISASIAAPFQDF